MGEGESRRRHKVAGAVVVVLCCTSAAMLSSPAALMGGSPAAARQQVLQQLDSGGFWSSLDNSVPLRKAAKEVDIGGRVVQMHQARRARPVPGQLNGGQFLSDTVRDDPNHLGVYGGMYWGQDTAPKHMSRQARGLVRRGDKWLRSPPRGQRGGRDAQVGGIIKALEHQASPPPPAWWLRKRQEWVQKQRIAAAKKALTKHLIKINPDFTGKQLESKREAQYHHGPALGGLRPVSLHKMLQTNPHAQSATRVRALPHAAHSASNILILPGKHLVHPHSAAAQDLDKEARLATSPRESTVEKALARAEAIRHKADTHLSEHDRAQAQALEKTAASLRTLAEAMSGTRFEATPDKLANIAKQLSMVSESLAGSAEKQETH